MRIEGLALALVAAMPLAGCVSTSVRGDVDDLRTLTHATTLADVSGPVDDAPATEVDEILAAPLDADAAVRIAMANNRELRATLRELGISRSRLLTAGLLANPTVEAELTPERQSAVAMRVEWDVASVVLAPLRSEAASADLDAARFDAAEAVLETGYEVRAAFYALAAAEESLAIAQRALEAQLTARDAARALGDAGNLRPLDVRVREAAFEEERVAVAERELEALVAREHVQRLLGLHGDDTAWTIAGALAPAPEAPADPEDLETRAVDASLALRALAATMVGHARRAGLARTEALLPELLVDLHALIGTADTTMAAPSTALGGGVALRLPIFDQGSGRVAMHEHALDAAFERYVGTAIEVRSAAREARARVLSSALRAHHYEAIVVPARQRVLDETVLQYDAMQVSVFQLLEALRARQDSEIASVHTRAEYWTEAAAMDALLAGHVVRREASARPPRAPMSTTEEL
ncbi:MAG: TolC family protein [Sandaracinus sp.]